MHNLEGVTSVCLLVFISEMGFMGFPSNTCCKDLMG